MMKKYNIDLFTLAWTILIPLGIGLVGSLFTAPAIEVWYTGLEKPFFNPPNWIFGPVWTALYIIMGIALYLVVQSKSRLSKTFAIQVFFTQLGLNLLWSILFFGAQAPFAALLEIVVLLIAIIFTVRAFAPHSKLAAWLFVPYILWVSFATVLNAAIVYLN